MMENETEAPSGSAGRVSFRISKDGVSPGQGAKQGSSRVYRGGPQSLMDDSNRQLGRLPLKGGNFFIKKTASKARRLQEAPGSLV